MNDGIDPPDTPILKALHLGGRKAESVAAQMGLTQDEYNAQYEAEMKAFKDWE